MKFFRNSLLYCMVFLAAATRVVSEEKLPDVGAYPNILEIKKHQKSDFIELKLRNGMTVFIRSTKFDDDEVLIQLIADGGFNSLDKELRPTAKLAARMIWKSGVGPYAGDKLPYFLYDNSIEMAPAIEPFSRQIEVSVPEENIEKALELIHHTFTTPLYSASEAETVIAAQQEMIRANYFDYDFIFKDMTTTLNSGAAIELKPMTIRGVRKVKSDEALVVFKQAFSNPAEFKAVIIGDFDLAKVTALVNRYLGGIAPKQEKWPDSRLQIEFPKGVREEVVPGKTRSETMVRITFPIKVVLDQQNFARAQLFAQAVEYSIRDALRAEFGQAYSIDSVLELPLYPSRDSAWFSIQYASSKDMSPKIKAVIFDTLRRLQREGMSSELLAKIKASQKKTDEFWLQDNHYLLSMVLNYSIWGWDPDAIIQDYSGDVNFGDASIQKAFKTYISLDHYTTISSVD